MAYDEALANRVRELIAVRSGVTEKKMFGGVAWMVGGNMAVGVSRDDLMVRVDPELRDTLLLEPGVRTFDMKGTPTKAFLRVGQEVLQDDAQLARWVDECADHAASLPPK